MGKRVMTPAVDEMTVKEERACLSEIRENNANISYKHLLHNGWTAGHFALKYVTGHYRKRKSKEKSVEPDADAYHPRADSEENLAEMNRNKIEETTYLSNPFYTRPRTTTNTHTKQTKRTQRYRSTAKSRILGMTVGDIRYCFQQLRNAGDKLVPDLVLYNGQCAGEFALCYLIETSNSMRNRRKRETNLAKEEADTADTLQLPDSQLPQKLTRAAKHNGKVTFA